MKNDKINIYRLNSDLEYLEGFGKSLRKRKVEQKYLYTGDWAKNYYNDWNVFDIDKWVEKDIENDKLNFWINIFDNLDLEKTVFISLWSWNWYQEKRVLEKIDSKLDFIWVDTSEEMLLLLDENFKKLDNNKILMKADISSYKFFREIKELTFKKYNKRIFSFLWNTIWSIENTSIVDDLYNLLNKWDQLWLDVRLRWDWTIKDDMKLFNAYEKWYNTKNGKSFLINILSNYGIIDNNAKIKIRMEKEKITDSLRFTMSYIFSKKTEVDIKWKIVFLEWEELDILSLHAFSEKWLIDFYELHWFKCVKKSICNLRWQFLFEKK